MKTINITSGELTYELLKRENEEFIPFNEAFIKGDITGEPFSEEFIESRVRSLGTTTDEYKDKMNGFLTFLNNIDKYDKINLFFGFEDFCQANKKQLLKSVKHFGYNGKITLNTIDEVSGETIFTSEISISGSTMLEEGLLPFEGFSTYYRIVNPVGDKTPLLFLHGGPGSTHNSFEVFDHLAIEDNRPFVMYDQIGCGKSSIPSSREDLWNKDTWIRELENVRKFLNLEKVNLLGHSWGGMLAIIYLCDMNPEGIEKAILSSTLSSASLWAIECHRLIKEMSQSDRDIIRMSEESGNFDTEEMKEVYSRYFSSHVFGPWIKGEVPECLTREKPNSKESYVTAWGPSEFSPMGNLKDYEYTDKLGIIKCPVMLMSGMNDESTPLQNKIMLDNISSNNKRWNLFEKSRHMSYYEEHESYSRKLLEFLNED